VHKHISLNRKRKRTRACHCEAGEADDSTGDSQEAQPSTERQPTNASEQDNPASSTDPKTVDWREFRCAIAQTDCQCNLHICVIYIMYHGVTMLCTVYLLQQALCLLDIRHRSEQIQECTACFGNSINPSCCQAQQICLESLNIILVTAQGTPCSR